jgi:hypothetical protein
LFASSSTPSFNSYTSILHDYRSSHLPTEDLNRSFSDGVPNRRGSGHHLI